MASAGGVVLSLFALAAAAVVAMPPHQRLGDLAGAIKDFEAAQSRHPGQTTKEGVARARLEADCPNLCSGHGKCVGGAGCDCDPGYDGEACAMRICLRNCGNRGTCVDGLCRCPGGWTGEDCLEKVIPLPPRPRRQNITAATLRRQAASTPTGPYDPANATVVDPANETGVGLANDSAVPPSVSGANASANASRNWHNASRSRAVSVPPKAGVPYPDGTTCSNDCSGRGFCWQGMCQCDPGFYGSCCCLGEAAPTAEELAAAAAATADAAELARLRATVDPMSPVHPDFDDRMLRPIFGDEPAEDEASYQ